MKIAVEQMCLSKTSFRSPFLFQSDCSQLEKEASSNHLERNWYLTAEKEDTVLRRDRKNMHLREEKRKREREGEGKGEVSNTVLGLHQTALSISDPDGDRDHQVPYPFPASSLCCPHHMAALRTE